MAELFANSQYAPRPNTREQQPSSAYPPYPLPAQSMHPSASVVDDHSEQPQSGQQSPDSRETPKMEPKPQATFLTKLYALLERPEYQSMIRWDANGEQIIVERPEQLALHVLPSIYRQSRFASFSRQLNIYGFMRKVNLRNVDPAIDDPDASTWSHPTLTRNSPPEVVANFKRRVPPRLPKQRKRSDTADGLPRLDVGGGVAPGSSSHPQNAGPIGLPTIPMSMAAAAAASDLGITNRHTSHLNVNRPRGLSAPGQYGQQQQQQQYAPGSAGGGLHMPSSATYPNSTSKWGQQAQQQQYNSRTALPPLSIPGGSSSGSSASSGLFTGGSFSGHPTTLGNLSPLSVHDGGHHYQPHSANNHSSHHDSSYGGPTSHHSHHQPSHHHSGRESNNSSVFSYGSGAFNSDPNASHGGGGGSGNHGNSNASWSSYLPPASSLGGANSSPSHGGNATSTSNLSSILNQSSGGSGGGSNPLPFPPSSRPGLSSASSYPSPYHQSSSSAHHGGGGGGGHHHPMSMSPDSRPATAYSNTSPYGDMEGGSSAADSSRPLTPASLRPTSAKSLGASNGGAGNTLTSLSIRNTRPRRRSDAVTNPYPSHLYGGGGSGGYGGASEASEGGMLNSYASRPGTAPEPSANSKSGNGIQLPSVSVVDPYHQFSNAGSSAITADFAYSPTTQHHPQSGGGASSGGGTMESWTRALRPSTSTSSISAASTSMIHTPPIMEDQEDGGNGASGGAGAGGEGMGRGRGGSTGSNGSINGYNDFFSISSSMNRNGGGGQQQQHHSNNNPFAAMLEEERRSSNASSKSLSPLGNLTFATAHSVSPGDIEFKDPFKALID